MKSLWFLGLESLDKNRSVSAKRMYVEMGTDRKTDHSVLIQRQLEKKALGRLCDTGQVTFPPSLSVLVSETAMTRHRGVQTLRPPPPWLE